jgi:hypothetical protein
MSRPYIALFALAMTLTLSACNSTGSSASGRAARMSTPTTAPLAASADYPAHCHARDHNQLPDPVCSPGATNPAVSQATIGTTICTPGWTATIRPSTSVTNRIKREAIDAYGDYAGSAPGGYELDHLISLELGGAPDAVANLWPEKGLHNSKDPVENAAKRAVCAHQITLTDAQHAIATNWITLGHRLGVSGIPAS